MKLRAALGGMLLLATPIMLEPGLAVAVADEGPELEPATGVTWRGVLDRAVDASTSTTYEASMVVVSFGEDGPGITEVRVRRGTGSGMSVSVSDAWLIARTGSSATYVDEEAGRQLRLGQIRSLPFAAPEVGRTYDVAVAGQAELDTGPAIALTFRRSGILRERIFVDDASGLVVRRETHDRHGTPIRVVAITELHVTAVDMEGLTAGGTNGMGERTPLGPSEVTQMAGHSWEVPTTVGDGFELRAGFAVDDGAAVQLLYSDGLYTMSIFEQPGRLAPDALAGSVRRDVGGAVVYRWPGVQPERMVWTGDGHVFTAVTDAPTDMLVSAITDLPHDAAPSVPTRVRRGLARLLRTLWPFD